jgi:hypothetical protein
MSDNIIIMDFDEGIRKRKMVREYDQDRQISDKIIIMKLMSNAHRAPVQIIHTSSGIYHSKKSCNKKLRKPTVSQEYVQKVPVVIVVRSNTSRSISRYGG